MSENMTASEPTTGEIVRALRCVTDDTECKDCRYKYPVGNVILCDHEQMNGNAADRLESQERELSGIAGELKALTARAEQAEQFVKCSECKTLTVLNTGSVYAKCYKRGITFFPFDTDTRRMGCMDGERGQPQEGEGV